MLKKGSFLCHFWTPFLAKIRAHAIESGSKSVSKKWSFLVFWDVPKCAKPSSNYLTRRQKVPFLGFWHIWGRYPKYGSKTSIPAKQIFSVRTPKIQKTQKSRFPTKSRKIAKNTKLHDMTCFGTCSGTCLEPLYLVSIYTWLSLPTLWVIP